MLRTAYESAKKGIDGGALRRSSKQNPTTMRPGTSMPRLQNPSDNHPMLEKVLKSTLPYARSQDLERFKRESTTFQTQKEGFAFTCGQGKPDKQRSKRLSGWIWIIVQALQYNAVACFGYILLAGALLPAFNIKSITAQPLYFPHQQ